MLVIIIESFNISETYHHCLFCQKKSNINTVIRETFLLLSDSRKSISSPLYSTTKSPLFKEAMANTP